MTEHEHSFSPEPDFLKITDPLELFEAVKKQRNITSVVRPQGEIANASDYEEETDQEPETEPEQPHLQLRDADGKINRRRFLQMLGIGSLSVVAGSAIGTVEAQDNRRERERRLKLWRSGAVQIITQSRVDGEIQRSLGQGYLVKRGSGYSVYTIGHVIEGEGVAAIYIPTSEYDMVEILGVPFDAFRSHGARRSDNDRSTSVQLLPDEVDLVEGYGLGEFRRERLPRQLRVGALLGSPRPDNGKWTVYQVVSIHEDTNLLKVRAIRGNQCDGRSGAPMVLMDEDYFPIIRDGKATVVGEVEGPFEGASEHDDQEGTGLKCAQYIRVNIAQL